MTPFDPSGWKCQGGLGTQQVAAEPPHHLTRFGIPKDDSRDSGNEDHGNRGRCGRKRTVVRTAGGGQEEKRKSDPPHS